MALYLDDLRKEFSDFLAESPAARWRMDAALTHVCKHAYEAGRKDGWDEAMSTVTREEQQDELDTSLS